VDGAPGAWAGAPAPPPPGTHPPPAAFSGWRRALHAVSTRLYGPLRTNRGFSWLGDERIAVGSVPTAATITTYAAEGITHAVNCRAPLQTLLSQDLWALRAVLGTDRVVQAPMWDSGRPQPARLWAPAARFAAEALEDPEARVLIHCQQGRRRSVLVAYAVLRLRGRSAEEAERLIAENRAVARLIPAYRWSVESWLRDGEVPLR
jgi:hypothetical protein